LKHRRVGLFLFKHLEINGVYFPSCYEITADGIPDLLEQIKGLQIHGGFRIKFRW
jgi:hypothetical protein